MCVKSTMVKRYSIICHECFLYKLAFYYPLESAKARLIRINSSLLFYNKTTVMLCKKAQSFTEPLKLTSSLLEIIRAPLF